MTHQLWGESPDSRLPLKQTQYVTWLRDNSRAEFPLDPSQKLRSVKAENLASRDYRVKEEIASQKHHATTALSDWLQSMHWDYFFTVTHRREVRDTIYHTNKLGQRLVSLTGVAKVFLATEHGNLSPNSIHHHGLISVQGDYARNASDLWRWSFNRYGRSAFSPIESVGNVSGYCSKYISKGLSEYGFFDSGIKILPGEFGETIGIQSNQSAFLWQ